MFVTGEKAELRPLDLGVGVRCRELELFFGFASSGEGQDGAPLRGPSGPNRPFQGPSSSPVGEHLGGCCSDMSEGDHTPALIPPGPDGSALTVGGPASEVRWARPA